MKAMVISGISNLKGVSNPLKLSDCPIPIPNRNQVLIKIGACAVCHTELDEIEGRTPPPKYPIIPGHQVVGEGRAEHLFHREWRFEGLCSSDAWYGDYRRNSCEGHDQQASGHRWFPTVPGMDVVWKIRVR